MREPGDDDRELIDAARAALFEITEPETVGAVVGVDDDVTGVVNVLFASTMSGYPGWRWNVAVSTVDGIDAPSIMEAELLPGEDSLLAPDWVPWADRLADYRAAQASEGSEGGDEAATDDDEIDGDDDSEDDLDEDDGDYLDPDDDEIDGVDFEDNDNDIDDDRDDETTSSDDDGIDDDGRGEDEVDGDGDDSGVRAEN